MATIRLIPSTYAVSNTSYLSVSNASNMYTNVDSTSYATITNTYASTSSRYLYLRGFNFNDIPANAVVSSFTVKIKGYETSLSTSTSYAPRLANGTSAISNTTASSNFGTSAKTITIPTGALTWEQITNYGSNFTIMVYVRRSSKNTTGYFYCYGAEIEVTYTIPVYHNITVSGTNVSPSGTQSVLEGTGLTVYAYHDAKPTIMDNGVDVSSQIVQSSSDTATAIPTSYTGNSNFTVSNADNAYTDADDGSYAQLQLSAGGTTGSIYFVLGGVTIPNGATIQSVSCEATLQYNRNGSSSGFTASCQLYANTTAKGSSTSVVTAGGTDVAKTTFTLSPGSWTASEVANARFHLTATNNASGTTRYIYVYGVSFNVTYEIDGVIYTYTLTNITADHTIVVTEAVVAQDAMFIKVNGSWVEVSAVYKKVNGSWVEQTDLTNVFVSGVNYKSG